MKDPEKTVTRPDKGEAAVCGLFCPSCSIYIGTKEDPERLKRAAEHLGLPVQEMECAGCRSDRRTGYCRSCKMVQCAAAKGIDFCGACEDYPCEDLKQFQAVLPHRIELWKSQERIKEVGYEQWYTEMLEHYACPQCGTVNSAYDKVCRKCGVTPGCRYVELNQDEILRRLVEMPRILEEFKAKLKNHPFAELIGLQVEEQRAGFSRLTIKVTNVHRNPHGVVHGAVVYALADTGMGSALYPTLAEGEICATIEIKINYFRPVQNGQITCTTEIINRGNTVANLESRVFVENSLVAIANGNYAIFKQRPNAGKSIRD